MASPATAPQCDIVEFDPNVPVQCALKYAGAGRIVSGRYGERVMYTLTDGRRMFLDLGPAQKINELNLNVRETFFVEKKWSGRKGDQIEWLAWLSPETERARAAAEMARMSAVERAKVPVEKQLQASLDQRKVGEQGDGTFAVEAVKPVAGVSAPATSTATPNSRQQGTMGTVAHHALVDEANALVDAYAQVLERTLNTYQGRIKPEECRSLLLSAYIQRGKNGGGYVA